jgi:pilus assembly protein Flp/PilA
MNRLINLAWRLRIWKDTRGQDLIEYALMAGFVAVAAGAVMPNVASSISTIFRKVSNLMTSRKTWADSRKWWTRRTLPIELPQFSAADAAQKFTFQRASGPKSLCLAARSSFSRPLRSRQCHAG